MFLAWELNECNTDSYQLCDAVILIKPTQDERLRIDIAILYEMLEKNEVKKNNWFIVLSN